MSRKRYWSFYEILRSYHKHLKENYADLITTQKYLRTVKEFSRFLLDKDKTLYSFNDNDLDCYRDFLATKRFYNRFYKPKYLARQFSIVSRFYKWGMSKSIFEKNPFAGVILEHEVKIFEGLVPDMKPLRYRLNPPEKYRCFVDELDAHEEGIGLSKGTIDRHRRHWCLFLIFIEEKGIKGLYEVGSKDVLDYQRSLADALDCNGDKISLNERSRRLTVVKQLYRYLARKGELKQDPSRVIELPKMQRGLPKVLLTPKEISRLMAVPDIKTLIGLRDRAILEALYSTGVRTNELSHVKVNDVDFRNGFLRINQPKGGIAFQRVVPIGDGALKYIDRYIKESRKKMRIIDKDYIFLNYKGTRFSKSAIYRMFKNHCVTSGIRKNVSPHCFRIACATGMLQRKADIRYVQEQLGHRSLQSTQIYARVVPMDLKNVHRMTHPREAGRGRMSL